ncbi:MAG: alpha-1,2-fucosyltransferase [Geobacter sp.]|nr:alpha-1,2-fucosyltransferase [Geobacter sp.]
MIIVKLTGGLGNQMFQYAAGRRLAHFRNTPLKLDLSWFSDFSPMDTPRAYALAPFSIQAEPSTAEETAIVREPKYGMLRQLFNKINPSYRPTHIREKRFRFDPSTLSLPGNVYLDGYWQSEKYFSDIASIIRREFTVRTEPDAPNCEVAGLIKGCEAVSIHFRRGDYVADAKTAAYHGICSVAYYHEAVKLVAARVDEPHFFVFSDDPAWVRENFAIPHPMTVVDHNGPDQAHEDLRLMSLCRHHIIANSSFSWWGAWLSDNPDKIVIAPRRWFAEKSIDTRDLLPEGWVRV